MVLLRQILFNLAIAAIAEADLMRISVEQVPSLHRVALMSWKLVTSSNFLPFILITLCTDVVRAVGHALFLFCADFHSIVCLRICW